MLKILLIEDDAMTRLLFQDCLEANGFQVIATEDGRVGIEQAKKHLPDLVLCDIFMSELSGYDVLSQLRQNNATASVPFIFVTAMANQLHRRRGMELGADDFLTKPLTVEQLLGAISARLERQAIFKRCFSGREEKIPNRVRTQANPSGNLPDIFPKSTELKDVFAYIEANYDKEITLSDVAQAIGYSPAYLTTRVKHETGKTINTWIIERRMAAARSLLVETDWSIEQIAHKVGYLNASYFFRQFRQYQGTTPKAWREESVRQN